MKKKCKAKTKQGDPCIYEAVIDGFCMTHFCINHDLKNSKKR